MPRRNRARRDEPRVGSSPGWARSESGPDGDWVVRMIPGSQTTKTYRCPGCDHEIRPGVAHVVAWPADESGSVSDRRHWHQGCWHARTRRTPTRRRW